MPWTLRFGADVVLWNASLPGTTTTTAPRGQSGGRGPSPRLPPGLKADLAAVLGRYRTNNVNEVELEKGQLAVIWVLSQFHKTQTTVRDLPQATENLGELAQYMVDIVQSEDGDVFVDQLYQAFVEYGRAVDAAVVGDVNQNQNDTYLVDVAYLLGPWLASVLFY